MNLRRFILFSLVLVACGLSGCQTDENTSTGNGTAALTGNVKTRGVYTTLATRNEELDMSASEYLQQSSFAPGETPAAVVVGYGNYNQPQAIKLELTEADTGRSLMSRDYYACFGKAVVQPLAIRLSGNYTLRLTSGGVDLDNWQFSVARTNSSGIVQINPNSTSGYGQGNFGIQIGPDNVPEFFYPYDDKLTYFIINAVTKEAGSITNADLFAQRSPGKVVFQCNLDFQGRLTGLKVLENTMDDDCAAVFQKALLERSPYDAWPGDVHKKFGADHLELVVTINFD